MSTATSCETSITAGKKCPKQFLLSPPHFRTEANLDFLRFELVDFKHRDDPDWEEWRSGLKGVIGGSDIAALLGHSTTISPRACLKQIYGLTKPKEPNHFAKTCMAHGKKYESTVLDVMRMRRDLCPGYSVVYEVCKVRDYPHGPTIRVCVSPDHYSERGNYLYEVKCPYVGSTGEFGSSAEFYDSEKHRYPCGKEGHFLQALFYRVMLNVTLERVGFDANLFSVALGYVNRDEEISVRCVNYWHDITTVLLITGLFAKLLDHTTPAQIETWRIKKADREQVSELMRSHIQHPFYVKKTVELNMDGSLKDRFLLELSGLQEQCRDDTWDDSPCVPGE